MTAIETHLQETVGRELLAAGARGARVFVVSAEADHWCFRIEAAGREFVIGFDLREQLRAYETTPGRSAHLASNDGPKINDPIAARAHAVRLVAYAMAHPELAPRDPPVI